MKKIFPLLVFILMIVSCRKHKDLPGPSSQSDASDLKLAGNVIAIDSSVALLTSDSATLAKGIYTFQYNGAIPSFSQNSIIVGYKPMPFLRKVNEVQINGSSVSLTTSEASLNDMFTQGNLSLPIDFGNLSNMRTSGSTNFNYSQNQISLYDKNGINLNLTNFNLSLAGTISNKCDFTNKNFVSTLSNGSLHLDSDISLQSTASAQISDTLSIANFSKTILVETAVGFPIPVTVEIDLKAVSTLKATSEITLSSGITIDNKLNMTLGYQNGDWIGSHDNTFIKTIKPFSFSDNIELQTIVELRPTITIKFFKVASASLTPVLNTTVTANENLTTQDFDLTSTYGLNTELTASSKIIGFVTGKSTYTKILSGPLDTLWQGPYTSEISGGNNQTGATGQQLDDPLEVTVKDLYGKPMPGITVHFSVLSGGGTLSDTEVDTDSAGVATTDWALGSGENKVQAKIAKADGTDIKGSPLTFTVNDGATTLLKTENDGSSTTTYTYDDEGRCTSITSEDDIITYTYLATSVKASFSDGSSITYSLTNGYLEQDNDEGWTYTVDSDGHHLSELEEGGSGNGGNTYSYTWVNENISSGNMSGQSFNGTITESYNYLSNQESRFNGLEWHDGKKSKNLVSSIIRQSTSGNTNDTYYNYEFDAQGRVTKETRTEQDHTTGTVVNTYVTTYTYQ